MCAEGTSTHNQGKGNYRSRAECTPWSRLIDHWNDLCPGCSGIMSCKWHCGESASSFLCWNSLGVAVSSSLATRGPYRDPNTLWSMCIRIVHQCLGAFLACRPLLVSAPFASSEQHLQTRLEGLLFYKHIGYVVYNVVQQNDRGKAKRNEERFYLHAAREYPLARKYWGLISAGNRWPSPNSHYTYCIVSTRLL